MPFVFDTQRHLMELFPDINADFIATVLQLANKLEVKNINKIARAIEQAGGTNYLVAVFYLCCGHNDCMSAEAFYAIVRRVFGLSISKDQVY